jgi:hypothetical protein
MGNKYFCRKGSHHVFGEEYYHQGKICKECRGEIENARIKSLTGLKLAEHLLHRSCIRALERVKSDKDDAYKGVKCQWDKPAKMKKDLMDNKQFWGKWVEQSEIYEKNGREINLRPTLDRIESEVSKEGHYVMENLQMLSHSENAKKAQAVECIVLFIKDLRIVKVVDYKSIKNVMSELQILGYNAKSINRDSGKIQTIGNGYSVLIQSKNGERKMGEKPLYKVVINKQKILFDRVTGEEYLLKSSQRQLDNYGIWINEGQVLVS